MPRRFLVKPPITPAEGVLSSCPSRSITQRRRGLQEDWQLIADAKNVFGATNSARSGTNEPAGS
jgi:hypothetical protein